MTGMISNEENRMSFRPTVTYSAASSPQAHLLVGWLAERGIVARVTNDFTQAAGGDLPIGWTAAAKVVVDEADADSARSLAAEFDARARASVGTLDDAAEAPPDEAWNDWPTCPACGERRQTECSYCGSAGNRFRLADIDEDERGQRILLACPACDDLFQPKFYRLCAQCGHDFGGGISIAPGRSTDDTRRVWVLLSAMGICAAFIGGYFYWLLR